MTLLESLDARRRSAQQRLDNARTNEMRFGPCDPEYTRERVRAQEDLTEVRTMIRELGGFA